MRAIYNKLADTYDFRSNNPTTLLVRREENKLIKKFAKGRVLDFGCGTGYHTLENKITSAVCVDISEKMLEKARILGIKNLIQSSEDLPFKNEKFDTIICLYSVFNLLDYKKAVEEFSRILKPGGHIVLSVASVWDNEDVKFIQKIKKVKKPERKRFRLEKLFMEMKLVNPEILIDIFSNKSFELIHFDSIYRLQKPRWGNFKKFSLKQKLKLKVEKILPKSYGCFYFFVFQKS